MAFDVAGFVSDCRSAAAERDASGAVREIVQAALTHGPAIDAELGTNILGKRDSLYSSPELTVERLEWPAGLQCTPHEHRTWAVVGIYTGTEVNWLYHRTAPGLAKQSTLTLDAGNVLVLDDTAIHAVANPGPHRTVGLHIYGADLAATKRSA